MKSKVVVLALLILTAAILVGACSHPPATRIASTERSLTLIPMDGPITSKKAELSGLAWHGDMLILLPQYPERFGQNDGVLFAIPKSAILNYLDGKSQDPITPTTIRLSAPGLKESIHGFEGYEAIGFSGENVYLTIESGKNAKMMGYLVEGKVSADQSELQINTSQVVKIPPPVLLDNRTDEALIVMGDRVLTFFEANGAQVNSSPAAHVFGLDLSPQGTLSFPNLEYRVTDATLGPDGQIWVINHFSPKDTDLLTSSDPLAEKYGKKSPQQQYPQVERLVALKDNPSGITLAGSAPLEFELAKEPRNWEGLVALDRRGFLLVTDKSPDTLLAFVPLP
ncbi:MAG TPA: hypothetical protein VK249_25555 [Anaerolineales bacterium]|nr:hypothetical protein [Anaerolineales bacterium]